jgi:hypothetical protein
MCLCGVDISSIKAAYYAMGGTMQEEVRLYIKPGIRSVSAGEAGVFDASLSSDNSVLVRPDVAEYLLANMPGVFSRVPFAKPPKNTPVSGSKEND